MKFASEDLLISDPLIVHSDDVYAGRLQHIEHHPEEHQHEDFNELVQCSAVVLPGGNAAIDPMLLEAHKGIQGSWACDVRKGPCSCGATH